MKIESKSFELQATNAVEGHATANFSVQIRKAFQEAVWLCVGRKVLQLSLAIEVATTSANEIKRILGSNFIPSPHFFGFKLLKFSSVVMICGDNTIFNDRFLKTFVEMSEAKSFES
jgi:hypothetical protein